MPMSSVPTRLGPGPPGPGPGPRSPTDRGGPRSPDGDTYPYSSASREPRLYQTSRPSASGGGQGRGRPGPGVRVRAGIPEQYGTTTANGGLAFRSGLASHTLRKGEHWIGASDE